MWRWPQRRPLASPLRRRCPHSRPYGGAEVAKLQRAYYPQIAPVMTALPPRAAFAVALATAQSMPGWIDVIAEPEAWRVEASQESFWMHFTDDISIRVSPVGNGSRIDVRSLSRQGRSDFGGNASPPISTLSRLGSHSAHTRRRYLPRPDCGRRSRVASLPPFDTSEIVAAGMKGRASS